MSTPDSGQDARAATRRVREGELLAFAGAAFRRVGVPEEAATPAARVLVAADVRGIASHGVARLDYYVTMIEEGYIDAQATPAIVRESATTALLDARNGLGQPAGVRAMTLALDKAAAHDQGLVVVRHSNHYGIAGYYAMLALERDMIGLSLTSTHPAVAPTRGKRAAFGTNPIAVAVPTAGPHPFVLDMATSVVLGRAARRAGGRRPAR